MVRFCAVSALALMMAAAALPAVAQEPLSDATRRLFEAIDKNDLVETQATIALGADVFARNERGQTPTELAVDRGRFEIAHYLLSVRNVMRAIAQTPTPASPALPEAPTASAPELPTEIAETPTATEAEPAKPVVQVPRNLLLPIPAAPPPPEAPAAVAANDVPVVEETAPTAPEPVAEIVPFPAVVSAPVEEVKAAEAPAPTLPEPAPQVAAPEQQKAPAPEKLAIITPPPSEPPAPSQSRRLWDKLVGLFDVHSRPSNGPAKDAPQPPAAAPVPAPQIAAITPSDPVPVPAEVAPEDKEFLERMSAILGDNGEPGKDALSQLIPANTAVTTAPDAPTPLVPTPAPVTLDAAATPPVAPAATEALVTAPVASDVADILQQLATLPPTANEPVTIEQLARETDIPAAETPAAIPVEAATAEQIPPPAALPAEDKPSLMAAVTSVFSGLGQKVTGWFERREAAAEPKSEEPAQAGLFDRIASAVKSTVDRATGLKPAASTQRPPQQVAVAEEEKEEKADEVFLERLSGIVKDDGKPDLEAVVEDALPAGIVPPPQIAQASSAPPKDEDPTSGAFLDRLNKMLTSGVYREQAPPPASAPATPPGLGTIAAAPPGLGTVGAVPPGLEALADVPGSAPITPPAGVIPKADPNSPPNPMSFAQLPGAPTPTSGPRTAPRPAAPRRTSCRCHSSRSRRDRGDCHPRSSRRSYRNPRQACARKGHDAGRLADA